jgi:hypothetical protein
MSSKGKRISLLLLILVLPFLSIVPIWSYADTVENLTSGKPFVGRFVKGDLNRVGDAVLVPEGTPWFSPEAVVLENTESILAVDLLSEVPIKALLLQADSNDSYYIEGSKDATVWLPLWEAPTVIDGNKGLWTRTKTLPYKIHARFLRIRAPKSNKNIEAVAVSRLQAFSSVPEIWPPELDYSLPESRLPLFHMVDARIYRILKMLLATVFLALLTWMAASLSHRENPSAKRTRNALLVLFIIVFLLVWPNFLNFHNGSFYKIHEFSHNYTGAKYTKELKYLHLYECMTVADMQDHYPKPYLHRLIRNLTDNTMVSTGAILANPEKCTSNFKQDRWEQFKQDMRFFRKNCSFEGWNSSQKDHGFNATPAWMILGTTISNLVPMSEGYALFLSLIDIFLLLAAGVVIFRTFGLESTFIAAGFFFLNGIASYTWTGGSYLRYDWFFFLAVGLSALRKNRGILAGFAFTYSALIRVFPGFVLLGLLLKALIEVISARNLEPLKAYRKLLLGFAIAVLVLIPLSLAVSGRHSVWHEFIKNSQKHIKTKTTNFMGLPFFLDQSIVADENAYNWIKLEEGEERAEAYRSKVQMARLAVRAAITVLYLLLFSIAVRRENLWVTAVVSIGLVPVLVIISNYYYSIFTFLALLWRVRPAAAYCLAALSWLSLMPITLGFSEQAQYTSLTVATLIFVFLLMGLVALRSREPETGESSS